MTHSLHGLRSTRNHYVNPLSLFERTTRALSSMFIRAPANSTSLDTFSTKGTPGKKKKKKKKKKKNQSEFLRRLISSRNILVSIWFITLWWGERSVFKRSLESCQWERWERWPSEANPHRVILIADPQLVDPHTYPDRPWPLSSMTIFYTDLYLRRSYSLLLEYLRPDTVFFLGDLFDGGREWSTQLSSSPDDHYKKYGDSFWMKEYTRFGNIFFSPWNTESWVSASEPRGRKIISSLPGNHDLGFAAGVQIPVKKRFDAYFGPLNRIDIAGNHTFVSLDTVSLSATDLTEFATTSLVSGDGRAVSTPSSAIWEPVQNFLDDIARAKIRAVKRELRILKGLGEQAFTEDGLSGFAPNISSVKYERHQSYGNSDDRNLQSSARSFPTILLTHVPLYRLPDTDCGPLRERNHAITVAAGYQYQNVLTPTVSNDIISKLGTQEVTQVYSGDDHDYCEIEHNEFTSRVREVTVKSMSWAMGVRRPGFLAVSLHNPVELVVPGGGTSDADIKKDTVQDHLCLLPDQLAIFIRYGVVLGITVAALMLRALSFKTSHQLHPEFADGPLLPLSNGTFGNRHRASISSGTSLVPDNQLALSSRSSRNHSPSKLGGYGNLPPSSRSSSPTRLDAFAPGKNPQITTIGLDDSDDWAMPNTEAKKVKRRGVGAQFLRLLWSIAWPVSLFYGWLLWYG